MFELHYRIVQEEHDEFVGQNGFFQIKCNGFKYGEVYSKELEPIVDKVSVYNWFERLAKVIKYLITNEYVALSDVESYSTWIEFHRKGEEVVVSIVKAEKEEGSRDIEFSLKETSAGEWEKQVICYSQLRTEIIDKLKEYVDFLVTHNLKNPEIEEMDEILKCI